MRCPVCAPIPPLSGRTYSRIPLTGLPGAEAELFYDENVALLIPGGSGILTAFHPFMAPSC